MTAAIKVGVGGDHREAGLASAFGGLTRWLWLACGAKRHV